MLIVLHKDNIQVVQFTIENPTNLLSPQCDGDGETEECQHLKRHIIDGFCGPRPSLFLVCSASISRNIKENLVIKSIQKSADGENEKQEIE